MAADKQRRKFTKARGFLLLLVAVFLYVFLNYSPVSSQTGASFTETGTGLELHYDDHADIYSYGKNGFFLTTKDGCNYYTTQKEIKWAVAYPISLKEPLMSGGGQYAGVSDNGGQILYMFSSEGLIYSKNYEDVILSFYVSAGGFVSVIIKNGQDYKIEVLNPKGEEINYYYGRNENVFPTGSSVSPDGRILAISVVDINQTVMLSKLMLLYNNADEKQPWLNGVFYQTNIENEFIAKMEFLSGNDLMYLTDSNLTCLALSLEANNTPGVKWAMPLNNKIDSVAVSKGKLIAIAYGEAKPGEKAKAPGLVELYNTDLRLLGEYEFTGEVSLTPCGGYITAGAGRRHAAFNLKGKRIWEYNSIADVKKIAVLENQNTALALEYLRAQVIKKR